MSVARDAGQASPIDEVSKDSGVIAWPASRADAYREGGAWCGETLGDWLVGLEQRYSCCTALVDSRGSLTYAALLRRASRFARAYSALGLREGDAVVVQMSNRIEWFETCFALWLIGARPVMAQPAHRYLELSQFLALTQAVAYVVEQDTSGFDFLGLAEQLQHETPSLQHVIVVGEHVGPHLAYEKVDARGQERSGLRVNVDASALALFQLSGGTTGTPKLVPRTHDDYLYSVRRSAELCALGPESVYLAALPVAHNFTLSSPGSLGTLARGGKVVLCEQSDPETVFAWIEREGVTFTGVVPSLAAIWEASARRTRRKFSTLRLLQVGGAKLGAPLAHRIIDTFGGLQQVFGMAEGLVNYTRLTDSIEVVTETQGRPLSELDEIRIVDERDGVVADGEIGELVTRGPYTVCGYYDATEHNRVAFTSDGFYRTGDLVRLRSDGNLVVEGRCKDQINRGGEKVAPLEVEQQLKRSELVREAALVADSDAFLGECSCAFIQCEAEVSGKRAALTQQLRQWLRDCGLAEFKIPDRFYFVETLPLTAVGKVDKSALKGQLADTLERRS